MVLMPNPDIDRVKTIGHIGTMPQVSVRNKLVEHAEEVFRRRGFNAAGVRDITEAAGVPKGSFYNHFETKEALAVEIVQRYCRATDFSDLSGASSSQQRLRNHFVTQVERTRATGVEFGCLLGTFASEIPTAGNQVRSAVNEGLAAWTGAVAATVQAGQEAREITSAHSAWDLAAFLIDSFEGSVLRAKAAQDHTVITRQLDIAFCALRA